MQNNIQVKYQTSISEEAVKKIGLDLKLKSKFIEEVCRIKHKHEIFIVETHGYNTHIGSI